MTTIRQLIQNSPARANELFAQLLDTSDTALKTREKLTAELTQELNEIRYVPVGHEICVRLRSEDGPLPALRCDDWLG